MEDFNPLNIPPGILRNGTEYSSKGRNYACNLIRFNPLRPILGWRQKSTSAMTGKGRSIIAAKDNSTISRAVIGTHSKLYAMDRAGALSNITPYRATGTLANDPFAVVDTQTLVTVTHTAHGMITGDTAFFSGATAGGGITIAGSYVITKVNDNSYTIVHSAAATSTDATTGGASVVYGYEISPGLADATATGGYGSGGYGAGTYGTPRPDSSAVSDVRMWSLDTWGEYFLATPGNAGDIYEWQLNTGTRATKITNSPTARAIVVTEERILMALGAGGNPRKVQWSDQEDNTDWTPSATNLSGDFELQTVGKLMLGKRLKGGNLLLTDEDAWVTNFVGYPLVYGFTKVEDNCGVISQCACAGTPLGQVWMGRNGFWLYNGFVQPLPCDVQDYVFADLNTLQGSKVSCWLNSDDAEVWWHYPSGGATENDRYVKWDYKNNLWDFGEMVRLSGCDRGAMRFPLAITTDGYVFEHEVGFAYDSATPYLETGPLEMGDGERLMDVSSYVPDEKTAGDATITLYGKMYPNDTETTYGPYAAANPTDLRITARQLKVRYTFTGMADSRIGVPRLGVQPGARR